MDLKGKRVLIFQQRGWAINIGHFLAKKLQDEGCRLAALTLKYTTHEFVLNQKEVKYDLIIGNDKIMSRPKDYLKGDRYTIKEICDSLGIDSIWPIVMSLRNHVRSYKDKYYYGFKQNVPDEEIIDYVMAVYKYIKYIFDNFKPNLIIAPNIIALPHIMFNLFAKRQGVKMVAIIDSKIRGYYFFTRDYFNNEGSFYDRVDYLNANNANSNNLEKAREYIRDFRNNFKKPDYFENFLARTSRRLTLKQSIKKELSPYYQAIRWFIKKPINYLESTGITIDYRPPKIILRDHYCQKKYKRFMDNFKYYPFDKLNKFVYFPLQFQPEASIDVIAPYFSNQIEVARQIAMSLPDDYVLAVKEHPGMVGLRPPSYIEKIDKTVNVKLIDYKIPNESILLKTDLVISPNSTALAETAFLRKPAIQLGNLGTTLKLPNVFKHTDMTTLTKKIKEVLKYNLNTEEYERKLENYVAAVFDTGFDVNYVAMWEKGKGGDKNDLWNFYKKEIKKIINKYE